MKKILIILIFLTRESNLISQQKIETLPHSIENLFTTQLINIDSVYKEKLNSNKTKNFIQVEADNSNLYTIYFNFGDINEFIQIVLFNNDTYITDNDYLILTNLNQLSKEITLPKSDLLSKNLRKSCFKIKKIRFGIKTVKQYQNRKDKGEYYDGILKRHIDFDIGIAMYDYKENTLLSNNNFTYKKIEELNAFENHFKLVLFFRSHKSNAPNTISRQRLVLLDPENCNVLSDSIISEVTRRIFH